VISSSVNLPAAKLINRVLSDYPMARERLAKYAGARFDTAVGPLSVSLRIRADGGVEPVGEGAADAPALTLSIPLAALPGLLARDAGAMKQVHFDSHGHDSSELAQTLSIIAQQVEWDIEEDVSQLLSRAGFGHQWADIVAHRAGGAVKASHAWRIDAEQRLAENVAEYLTHERDAFATEEELDQLRRDNQTLRDDVARLEARLLHLQAKAPT
jgi:ubiquinone biosynthesis accessory factor UbiJ